MSSKPKEVVEDETPVQEEKRKQREEEVAKKKAETADLLKRKEKQAAAAREAADSYNKKKSSGYLYYYIVFGFLGALCVYVIVMMLMNQTPALHKVPVIDDIKIDEHNQYNTWKQGSNKFFEVLI